MNTTAWTVIVWLVLMAAITIGVALAIVFFAYRAPVKGLVAQARTGRYVFAYDDALQWLGLGYRERGRLTDELRSNIAAAAADAPVAEVLERMGPAKDLARGVAARRRGPTWIMGAAAALAAVTFQVVATILMQLTFLSTVKKLASPGETVSVRAPLGLVFEGTLGDEGWVQAASSTSSAASLILPVVAFLLCSRPWRMLTAKAARRASEI